jgi:hypothetical protein
VGQDRYAHRGVSGAREQVVSRVYNSEGIADSGYYLRPSSAGADDVGGDGLVGPAAPSPLRIRYAASLPCIAFGERRAVARRSEREDTVCVDSFSLRLRVSEVVREAMRGGSARSADEASLSPCRPPMARARAARRPARAATRRCRATRRPPCRRRRPGGARRRIRR